MWKHHDQKQPQEERVYFTFPYHSSSLEAKAGIQMGQELGIRSWSMHGPWRNVACWLALMACSACFMVEPRITSPGMALSTVGWAFFHQSLMKRMPFKLGIVAHTFNSNTWEPEAGISLSLRPVWCIYLLVTWGNFSIEVPSCQMTLVCDIKLATMPIIPDGIFYSKNSRIDLERDYLTCTLLNLFGFFFPFGRL